MEVFKIKDIEALSVSVSIHDSLRLEVSINAVAKSYFCVLTLDNKYIYKAIPLHYLKGEKKYLDIKKLESIIYSDIFVNALVDLEDKSSPSLHLYKRILDDVGFITGKEKADNYIFALVSYLNTGNYLSISSSTDWMVSLASFGGEISFNSGVLSVFNVPYPVTSMRDFNSFTDFIRIKLNSTAGKNSNIKFSSEDLVLLRLLHNMITVKIDSELRNK